MLILIPPLDNITIKFINGNDRLYIKLWVYIVERARKKSFLNLVIIPQIISILTKIGLLSWIIVEKQLTLNKSTTLTPIWSRK